jgi:hypothetical protein
VDELRASHQDIKDVLTEGVLFERWQQIGAELGFTANPAQAPRDISALNHQPEMSDAWS